MCDKRIVYTRPDGGTAVIVPAPDFVATFESEDQALAEIQKRNVPAGATNVMVVHCSVMPSDRTFRDAWVSDGSSVDVDMPKAREIQGGRIKDECRIRLRGLIEREAMGEEVSAEKTAIQRIDAAPQIAAARTPDELKAVWPF